MNLQEIATFVIIALAAGRILFLGFRAVFPPLKNNGLPSGACGGCQGCSAGDLHLLAKAKKLGSNQNQPIRFS